MARRYASGDDTIEQAIEALRNADDPLRGVTKRDLIDHGLDPLKSKKAMGIDEYTNDIHYLMDKFK